MPNFAYSSTPSPQVPELRKKWTVSPEFSDALLAAMRERTRTAGLGPLPRLPSMLQLSPVSPESPTLESSSEMPSNPDSTERLKMKTRVAIRDRNPHRFQVVPLGEVKRFTGKEEASPRVRRTPAGSHPRSRSPLVNGKAHADENTAPTSTLSKPNNYLKTDTPDRTRTLSERNRNLPAPESTSLATLDPQQTTSGYQGASESPTLDVLLDLETQAQPILENTKPVRRPSSLRASTTVRRSRHFKSPSLGNIRPKPNLEVDMETPPLPRVGCRKRTNTLSADHHFRQSELVVPPKASNTELEPADIVVLGDRRNLAKKDSVRRHAIYTQSLYVPVHDLRLSFLDEDPMGQCKSSIEEPSSTAAICRSSLPYARTDDPKEQLSFLNEDPSCKPHASLLDATALLRSSLPYAQPDSDAIDEDQRPRSAWEARAGKPLFGQGSFAFRSSIPSERALSLGPASALGFFNMPRGFPERPQSSLYDDDNIDDVVLPLTRPLTRCTSDSSSLQLSQRSNANFGKLYDVPLPHHPIVLLLLMEVDKAIEEWNSIRL
ncbi:hypothetical protein DXG03_003986 [Asterophora parasitica]|uniref:Uncharacterized protein n=1 Tax=Asterophora parasitica TaxID=117018 RepID=A0A9P7G339_9AGAR|nr:hypothetical protein DXG03_003986 [Asterophora parasitica]